MTILLAGFGLLLPWGLAIYRRFQVRAEEIFPGWIGWCPFFHSLLAYVPAFNLTSFLQELFLVWPKALVPGLTPTRYHNRAPIAAVLPMLVTAISLLALFQLVLRRGIPF